jgi:hypothetical protein
MEYLSTGWSKEPHEPHLKTCTVNKLDDGSLGLKIVNLIFCKGTTSKCAICVETTVDYFDSAFHRPLHSMEMPMTATALLQLTQTQLNSHKLDCS